MKQTLRIFWACVVAFLVCSERANSQTVGSHGGPSLPTTPANPGSSRPQAPTIPTPLGPGWATPQQNTGQLVDIEALSQWTSAGRKAYSTGNINESVASFSKALAINPNDSDLYGYRGTAYALLARQQDSVPLGMEALRDFEMALAIDPGNSTVRYYSAWTNTEVGYRRQVQKDQRSANENFLQATRYLDVVISEIEAPGENPKRLAKKMWGEAYGLRGWNKYNGGDLKGALPDYEQAFTLDPDNKNIAAKRGQLLADLQRMRITSDAQYREKYYGNLSGTNPKMQESRPPVKKEDVPTSEILGTYMILNEKDHGNPSRNLDQLFRYQGIWMLPDRTFAAATWGFRGGPDTAPIRGNWTFADGVITIHVEGEKIQFTMEEWISSLRVSQNVTRLDL